MVACKSGLTFSSSLIDTQICSLWVCPHLIPQHCFAALSYHGARGILGMCVWPLCRTWDEALRHVGMHAHHFGTWPARQLQQQGKTCRLIVTRHSLYNWSVHGMFVLIMVLMLSWGCCCCCWYAGDVDGNVHVNVEIDVDVSVDVVASITGVDWLMLAKLWLMTYRAWREQ